MACAYRATPYTLLPNALYGSLVNLFLLCTKGCGREAAPRDYWCRPCRAQYMRSYRGIKAEMKRWKEWRTGVEAMRNQLIVAFEQIGRAELNGYTARDIVKLFQLIR